MATMERAGDIAPPNGIPRPVTLVRFFDENGDAIGTRRFTDPAQAEEYATALLGMETAQGATVCLARFFVADGNGGWVYNGEEMEF